jgi:epoxyqueuosine reductase
VDSAPILEKQYAVEAGLGWIGRQSLLVTPDHGTFVLLGEIVMTAKCDDYDKPLERVGCGACRRCVEACPNGAIRERHIDTTRCISCATIERRGEGERCNLHGWIFGCDECQSVCPYNRKAPHFTNPRFAPLFNPVERTPDREEFKDTPMMRRFRS